MSCLLCAGVLTALLLQHPDLELHQAVGVEAVVLPDAAVATLVAADVQLVHRTDRPDLGVAHGALLQDVNQAPGGKTEHVPIQLPAAALVRPVTRVNRLTCGSQSCASSPGASKRRDRPCWSC